MYKNHHVVLNQTLKIKQMKNLTLKDLKTLMSIEISCRMLFKQFHIAGPKSTQGDPRSQTGDKGYCLNGCSFSDYDD